MKNVKMNEIIQSYKCPHCNGALISYYGNWYCEKCGVVKRDWK